MTQKTKVLNYLNSNEKATIKQCSNDLDIVEPNIRRILGIGTKEGLFERLAPGVYQITIEGKNVLYLYEGNCLEILPQLINEGIKADNIFLDIPYDTPAVKGGNRGIKYPLMSLSQFKELLSCCNQLLKDNTSTITYMYSNATSGLKKMQQYTDCFINYGFIPLTKGKYYKTYPNGKPTTNMRGNLIKPEGVIIFSKSYQEYPQNLKWTCIRPKGYQTEKSSILIKDLIELTTKENDLIIDPCAGSGVVGKEAIKINRKAILIDKNIDYIKQTL
jgi:DNA modification methylase